jgi:hypothetical protein
VNPAHTDAAEIIHREPDILPSDMTTNTPACSAQPENEAKEHRPSDSRRVLIAGSMGLILGIVLLNGIAVRMIIDNFSDYNRDALT